MLDYVQSLHKDNSVPTLIRFPTCKIEVRPRDHRPPHVHVLFADGREALVDLASGQVTSRRKIRATELAEALAWIDAHAEELIARFEELQR